MADSVELDPGSGGALVYVDELTVATSTLVAQRVKIQLGADGVDDGAVHSSNPLPVSTGPITANIGTVSSLATQATLAQVSTFTNSSNTLLVNLSSNTASSNSLLSSNKLRLETISTAVNSTNTMLLNIIASSTSSLWVQSVPGSAQSTIGGTVVIRTGLFTSAGAQIDSFGGGTQYVDGNTTTLPTGTVMLWKSAVSTIVPASSGQPLPVNVVAGSLNANTEYVEGDTSTAPTGIVMLWKAGVSTLRAASTSDPFPVSTLPATVTLSATDNTVLDNISTFTNSTNTLLVHISSNTASSNALVSTQGVTLGNISTFTNSTNTLLVQISSNTASTNALISTQSATLLAISSTVKSISTELAPTPTGIYVQPVPVSSNGLSTFMTLDADETEEQISATACTVYGVWAANTGTSGAYVKLFNGTSSAIQVSSATPLIVIPIPGSSTQSLVGANYNVGGMGITFSTACCVAAVTGAANNNTTAPAESTIICNIFYKN